MPVQVFTTVQALAPDVVRHAGAARFAVESEAGYLTLRDAANTVVAQYAPGMWACAEVLPAPVDAAATECRERAKRAMEQALIFEGWTPPGGFDSVNAAEPLPEWERHLLDKQATAEPDPVREYRAHVEDLNRETVETTTELTATLSETSDPFVCVSVTGSDADEVLKVWRNATATTTTPAINFDWRRKPRRDDDGPAGVREPVRP